MQLLSCWISYLTFVAIVIDEMFQNYEFKLVDGKCCPECVEGAHQFQVLPPLYFSLSIFSIFVLITYNECRSYRLSYIFCKSNILYIFDGVFLAESLSSMQTGRFSLKNSKELRSVFATYCLTITTVVFRSLSTPSLVLPWSVLFGEKERSCMNWFAVRSRAILESLLSHARRLSAVKKKRTLRNVIPRNSGCHHGIDSHTECTEHSMHNFHLILTAVFQHYTVRWTL